MCLCLVCDVTLPAFAAGLAELVKVCANVWQVDSVDQRVCDLVCRGGVKVTRDNVLSVGGDVLGALRAPTSRSSLRRRPLPALRGRVRRV